MTGRIVLKESPTELMDPIIRKGSPVVVDRFYYAKNEPERWHVVLFALAHRQVKELPAEAGGLRNPAFHFIKRVVGLPGERVRFTASGIYVNDRQVSAPEDLARHYANFSGVENFAFGAKEFEVPDESLFVVGDNTAKSKDSRHFGAVSYQCVVGRVVA